MLTLGFFNSLLAFLEPLTAACITWVNQNIQDNAAIRKMKALKRYCRVNKLNRGDILTQAALCFPNQTSAMQAAIAKEVGDELRLPTS